MVEHWKTNSYCRKYVSPSSTCFALRQSESSCNPTSNWYCYLMLSKKNEPTQKGVFHDKPWAHKFTFSLTVPFNKALELVGSHLDMRERKLPNQEIMDSAGISEYSLASKSQCKLIMQWISHLTIYFLSPLLCELERVLSKVHLVSSYKLVLVLLDLGIVFVLLLQYSLPRVILFSLVLWPLVSLGVSITPVIHHGHLKFHHSRDSLFSFD